MLSLRLPVRSAACAGLLALWVVPAISAAPVARQSHGTKGRQLAKAATSGPVVSARAAAAAVATPGIPAAPPATAGVVVGIDPETGRLGMPTPPQLQQLSAQEMEMVSRSQAGLVEHRLPGGAVYIDLEGRFQDLVFVRIGPDGSPTFECVEDSAAARGALRGRTPLSGGLEVK